MFNQSFIRLIFWIISLQVVSGLLGVFTQLNRSIIYPSYIKSTLTPPDYVFGIVWPILYISIAIAGWWIWEQSLSTLIKRLYLTQLFLNWSWTPIFFYLGQPLLALIILAALLISLALLQLQLRKETFMISLLLLPYLLWSSFALYLNYIIAINI